MKPLTVILALLAQAPAPGLEDVERLEQALMSNPDDLRAGSDYRMAILRIGEYDRGLETFRQLVAKHPDASNGHLNYGLQYVDKIPVAGAITQVILANNALSEFTKAIELKPSWLGYYVRGNSYLFWPRIFGRTSLAIADLEQALAIQAKEPKRSYHVRVFVSLGDAHWKVEDLPKARAVWKEGAAQFPDNAGLKQRLALEGDALKALIESVYDPNKRVDSNLEELWSNR